MLQRLYDFAVDLLANPDPSRLLSIGWHTWLGSGYSVEKDTEARIDRLRQLQLEATTNPAWMEAPDGRTFCNRASAFIAQGMGFMGFPNGELADDMIGRMSWDAAWIEDTLERAFAHALKGGLAFVTLTDHPHGHLCSIAPEPKQESTSWVEFVPMVANVGKAPNGVIRLSGAFKAADKARIRCFLLKMEDA